GQGGATTAGKTDTTQTAPRQAATRENEETNPPVTDKAAEPLNMLVLGDSIMWGQGLRQRDKIWWRVKNWLQEKTGRPVHEIIKAHSGAVIELGSPLENAFTSNDGEVNLFTPTINQQVDDALGHYSDPSKVDLVLVDGCINDVDVNNLLDTSMPLDPLETSIREKCGTRMQSLLTRIAKSFPRAHMVVTGYYRIVSPETDNNSFTRLLIKKLTSHREQTSEEKLSDREMKERLVAISETWYKVSTASLAQAIAAVNSELRQSGSTQRVLFAEIEFAPEHAFSAPQTLLWNFKFASTNLSGLRKAIVILTLGTAAYKPDDDVRQARSDSCKQTYRKPKDRKETKPEKQHRELSQLACRYASLGHPNKMGALIYTESIKGQLRWLMTTAGWPGKPATVQSIPAQ
ncbi:MAG TPA: SGNH/GDSL hydrolase family protein, partial [Pyrinomonadaceae bacterium]|nr:SGNH/GDSL hydrolase family protein [Pyrinomonadaceae bacterium]